MRLMTKRSIDFERLLKSRLVIARFGEMDLARWWNTRGQLGKLGAATLRRGFPRTHRFAHPAMRCPMASRAFAGLLPAFKKCPRWKAEVSTDARLA
ncbi:BrxE family protein [Mesorhizobium sp.]|uniref:BrxE family protein n=1 Tax=Mesorhizobium sp. TaxID=1871066 RepID=UPI0033904153